MSPQPLLRPPHAQAYVDLAHRAKGGIVVHPLLWLLVGWQWEVSTNAPFYFWGIAALFAAIMVLRVALERRLAERAAQRPAARWAFRALLLSNPLYWGVLAALSTPLPELAPARIGIWFAISGVAASGGMSLVIDPMVRVSYPLLVVLPSLTTILLMPTRANVFTAAISVLFLLYLSRASKVVESDYWTAVDARIALEERARQLEHLSITDGLTQLNNRQHFDRQLAHEWARAQRDGLALAMVMIDVDHFKRINDRYGHPFGDACLQAVAQALRDSLLREGDLLARYGGEEFAVLLPSTESDGAAAVAARLHAAVAAVQMLHEGQAVPVTVSIGVHALANVAGSSTEQLIGQADEALYTAKHQGRNCVVMSAPPTTH